MTTVNIYHFEDAPTKRGRLQEILGGLNERGKADGIEFVDHIGSSWTQLVDHPVKLKEIVLKAAEDPNGISLVDVRLRTPRADPADHPYKEAARLLREQILTDGRDVVVRDAEELIPLLQGDIQRADVELSALMVAMFCNTSSRFAWASNVAFLNVTYLPARFSAPSLSIPEGAPSPADPARICRAIDVIYQLALVSTWLTPGEFIQQCVDFVPEHPTDDDDKLSAGELLRRFLRLGKKEFDEEFGDGQGGLHQNTLEALKVLFGARSGLDLRASWLLALGVYRSLFPTMLWRQKWDPSAFRNQAGSAYLLAFSITRLDNEESRAISLGTLNAYLELCGRIFAHKDTKADILCSARLEQRFLQFHVVIDFNALREAVIPAFRRARGEDIGISENAHDTSKALLRFLVSSVLHPSGEELISATHAPLIVSEVSGGLYVQFGK